METCGTVTIEKKGALVIQKRLVTSDLTLRGSLKGNSIVFEKAHIAAGAQLVGDLEARVLTVEDGATLKGFLRIVPSEGSVVIETPKEMIGRLKS
jgi:cytoskeletal protein CcmA (bactofilin family)